MKNKRNNYTLTEILVVVIILGVVMAIALPGFNNLVNGNKTMRAAKQLATAFQQARAEAIVSGCRVVLVLPCRRPTTDSDAINGLDNIDKNNTNIRLNYSNSSYGILVADKNNIISLDNVRNSDFKWHRLPGGVIISKITYGSFAPGTSDYFPNYNDGNSNNDGSMPFVEFDKSSLPPLNPGDPPPVIKKWTELSSTCADLNLSSTNKAYLRVGRNNTGNFGHVPCVVFYPDGTSSASLRVFLTEGYVKSNGELTATNINSSAAGRPFNSVGFEFNRFTGRISYYETL